jgi:hypothetical protein
MKNLKYAIGAVCCLFMSCTKQFLDVENTQQLFRESYVKDLNTLNQYLRGVYYNLYTVIITPNEATVTYPDLAADNLRPLTATSSPNTVYQYYWRQEAHVAALRNMSMVYRNSYLAIRMCNFVIDHVHKYRSEDPAKADDMKGQALALRAFMHFNMVVIFAQPYSFTAEASHPGIPVVTSPDPALGYTRQSVKEVYASIISDLQNAAPLMPEDIADTRYMSRQAAKALLARAFLFSEDYVNAKKIATEVAARIPLLSIAGGYPNDMFKFKPSNATEALFQLLPGSNNLNRWVKSTPIRHSATSDLAAQLQEYAGDIRRNWIKDTTITAIGYKLVKKFPSGVAPEFPAITNLDLQYYTCIVRSSEMFLTVAEAAAKSNDEDGARTYLNAVRKRAWPQIADVTASGPALLDSIYKERRKELSFEGLRLYDLQRLKQGVNRIDYLAGAPASLPYPSNKAIAPIPIEDVLYAGIQQNPGY